MDKLPTNDLFGFFKIAKLIWWAMQAECDTRYGHHIARAEERDRLEREKNGTSR